MEEKIALVNCLNIIHCESLSNDEVGTHYPLIKSVINAIKLPDLVADGDDRASLVYLRHYINEIIGNSAKWDRKQFLNNFRISCPFDAGTLKSLSEVLEQDTPADDARNMIDSLVPQLEMFVGRINLRRHVNMAMFALSNTDGSTNTMEAVAQLREQLALFDRPPTNDRPASFVGAVGTADSGGFSAVFEQTKKELDGASFKTGWIGMNRMLGIKGGISPGELIIIPALPHNAKTTFSLSLFLSMCLFNEAKDFVEEGKRGLFLDISLENELSVNIPLAYKMIKEYETGEIVDLHKVDPQEAELFIKERLKRNGWDYVFERHVSTDFSIETFKMVVNFYERQGYQVVASRIDYLGVANKAGLGNGTVGSEVRETYRRARNTGAVRKMVVISPHQLSPAAKALKAMDPDKYVRLLPGRGMFDGCTTIDNEADLELYIGITEKGDSAYLEIQRGKHRTLVDTPIKHRYGVLKFADVGTLPWDIETGMDSMLSSVNADKIANETDDFLGGLSF